MIPSVWTSFSNAISVPLSKESAVENIGQGPVWIEPHGRQEAASGAAFKGLAAMGRFAETSLRDESILDLAGKVVEKKDAAEPALGR